MPRHLDRIDVNILAELQRDARLTNLELAERAALSPSACLARVRKLREAGFIDRDVGVLSPSKIGPALHCLLEVTLKNHSLTDHTDFESGLAKIPAGHARTQSERAVRLLVSRHDARHAGPEYFCRTSCCRASWEFQNWSRYQFWMWLSPSPDFRLRTFGKARPNKIRRCYRFSEPSRRNRRVFRANHWAACGKIRSSTHWRF